MPKVSVSKARAAEKPEASPSAAHPLLALRRQMDHLFEEFARDWHLPTFGRDLTDFEPFRGLPWTQGAVDVRFDVSESDDAIEVMAELPGLDEKDVEVTLSDGLLMIKGEKNQEEEKKEKDYYVSERRFGSFMRSIRVPSSVDESKVSARFDKGVLKVVMPKRAEAKSKAKKIEIAKG